jgi:alpha-amylase
VKDTLGFDSIYISPFVENTNGGYHGYWAKNIYKVNHHMGTENDLRELVRVA